MQDGYDMIERMDDLGYMLAMDGVDEEIGDVTEDGVWYGLIAGFSEREVEQYPELAPYRNGGAIVKVNDLGFRSTIYYTNRNELMRDWVDVVRSFL